MFQTNRRHHCILGLVTALLGACGGGGVTAGTPAATSLTAVGAVQGTPASVTAAFDTVAAGPAGAATSTAQAAQTAGANVLASVIAVGAKITDMRVRSTASTTQTQVPVTFGQVFAPGALRATESLTGQLSNGAALPLQIDVKATHPDGRYGTRSSRPCCRPWRRTRPRPSP